MARINVFVCISHLTLEILWAAVEAHIELPILMRLLNVRIQLRLVVEPDFVAHALVALEGCVVVL